MHALALTVLACPFWCSIGQCANSHHPNVQSIPAPFLPLPIEARTQAEPFPRILQSSQVRIEIPRLGRGRAILEPLGGFGDVQKTDISYIYNIIYIYVFLPVGKAILEPLGGFGGGNKNRYIIYIYICVCVFGRWEGYLGASWGLWGRLNNISIHLSMYQIYVLFLAVGRAILEPLGDFGEGNKHDISDTLFLFGYLGVSWGLWWRQKTK